MERKKWKEKSDFFLQKNQTGDGIFIWRWGSPKNNFYVPVLT